MRDRADVLVLGSGIVGLSLAFELARRGLSTAVVPDPPGGPKTSEAGAGLVHPQTRRWKAPEAVQDLALLSRHLHGDWLEAVEGESGLSSEYDVRGGMAVALTDAEEVELDRSLDWQRVRALPFDVLPGEEALSREASLSEEVRSAFVFPLDGILSASRLHRSLALAARSAGVRFLEGHLSPSLLVEGGRAAGLETSAGRFAAPAIIDATERPGNLHRAPRKPVEPVSSLLVHLDASDDAERPGRLLYAGGAWIVPGRDGFLRLLSEPFPSTAGGPTAGGIADLLRVGLRTVPAIASYRWVGTSELVGGAAPDAVPLLGETDLRGFHLAAGLGADASLLAPAVALFVADLVTGQAPPLPPAPFSSTRF